MQLWSNSWAATVFNVRPYVISWMRDLQLCNDAAGKVTLVLKMLSLYTQQPRSEPRPAALDTHEAANGVVTRGAGKSALL